MEEAFIIEIIQIEGKSVVKRTFFGDIFIHHVVESFEIILQKELIKNHDIKAIITDLTHCNIKFKMTEFRNLIVFIKHNATLSGMPMGVISDSPVKSIFPTIASATLGIKVKPFNSFDECIEWVKTM